MAKTTRKGERERAKHRCDNCVAEWTDSELKLKFPDIPNLLDRLTIDGIVPSGQCPDCGSLCYEIDSRWVESAPVERAFSLLASGDYDDEAHTLVCRAMNNLRKALEWPLKQYTASEANEL